MSKNNGWIKLYRSTLDSRVFANEGLLKVWIWCLCRANFKERFVPIKTGKGSSEVSVGEGQFIFGRSKASKALGMNPSTVYKRMKKLEEMGNINMQSNSHYSIVSLCNWGIYQNVEPEEEQPNEQAGNNQVAGREQAGNTDKNVNNDNNEKNDKTYVRDLKTSDLKDFNEFEVFAFKAWERIINNYPDHKTVKEARLKTWSEPVRLANQQDNIELGELWEIFEWASKHNFWKPNIRSTSKLRDQFETLKAQKQRDEQSSKSNSTLRKSRGDRQAEQFFTDEF